MSNHSKLKSETIRRLSKAVLQKIANKPGSSKVKNESKAEMAAIRGTWKSEWKDW
jgi:histone H3/H4